MIYKITFEDGRIDWCTAKDQLHLLKAYDKDFDLSLQDIESIDEVSDEEAKTTMFINDDFDGNFSELEWEEISLYDAAWAEDEFRIVASTEYEY